ncbi:hypothetical protein SRHO_G00320400 [Serrasalmus rhombeus]
MCARDRQFPLQATVNHKSCMTEQSNKGCLKSPSSAEPTVHIPDTERPVVLVTEDSQTSDLIGDGAAESAGRSIRQIVSDQSLLATRGYHHYKQSGVATADHLPFTPTISMSTFTTSINLL